MIVQIFNIITYKLLSRLPKPLTIFQNESPPVLLTVKWTSIRCFNFSDEENLEVIEDFAFAAEIRLGWYFDGIITIPVTGGSVSGNIKDLQKEIYLSKELQRDNNFVGPKIVKLLNVSVAGIE